MTKSVRNVAIIAILLSTLSGLASAQGRANTSTTQANLHIQVNVVQVVTTDQDSKATPETAVSYSIPMGPTAHERHEGNPSSEGHSRKEPQHRGDYDHRCGIVIAKGRSMIPRNYTSRQ